MTKRLSEKKTAARQEILFIKQDLYVDAEDEELRLDAIFAQPGDLAQKLYIQRQLNSSGR
jgi:hypothetical protein